MDLRLILAILAGKIIRRFLKLSGSGATAAPGLYALKIDPNLVLKLTQKNNFKSIVVSGTNGKTTTSRLIAHCASKKYKIINNRQGSNLLRGAASTLLSKCTLLGKIEATLAIWESDEAALPQIVENTNPQAVVLLNLFRDQLDRYGEIDTIRTKWISTLKKLPKSTKIILNADDPGISYLGKFTKGNKIFFGVEENNIDLPQIEHTKDVKFCHNCHHKLCYSSIFSSHLGKYQCKNCGLKRPKVQTFASNLKFKDDFSTIAQFSTLNSPFTIHYSLPGLYNVYNILAAVTILSLLKIQKDEAVKNIKQYSTAFGRFQKHELKNTKIVTFLIKNPVGANEVLRILSEQKKLDVLAILNDKIADGRDVSWIWDTRWEFIKDNVSNCYISGTRSWDMALRLKYANFNLNKNEIYENINYSIKTALKKSNKKSTLVILTTYTALLEVQKTLTRISGGTKWHEQ